MIGWENNHGAYFINKLSDQINNTDSDVDGLTTTVGGISTKVNSMLQEFDTIAIGSSLTLSCESGSHFVLFCIGSSSARSGAWNVYVASTGTVVASPIGTPGASLTITTTTNTLTIASTGTGTASVVPVILLTAGKVTVSNS